MIRPAGILTASVLALSQATAPEATLGRTPTAPACSTIAGPSRRLELADGRIVSVDVQSVARAGRSVLAVGRFAYVFPPTANSRTSPELVDSIMGVLLDDGGRVALVGNPAQPRTVRYVRAAAMPDGSFAVLYATHAPEGLLVYGDTGTLWLAMLQDGRWKEPARVAAIRTSSLDRGSALLQHDGQLSFLYPFRDDRRYADDGGVVLLRGRKGAWKADTLRTATEPSSVVAVHDPGSSTITAAIAVADSTTLLVAQKVYIARFDSSWSQPLAVAGDGLLPVALPMLGVQSNGLVASWLTWPESNPARGWLQWLQLDAEGHVKLRSVIDSGVSTFPYELVIVDGRQPLWLYHGEPFGSVVRLVTTQDSVVTQLPDMKAEFWNPGTKTVALSGSRFLVFTQRRAQTNTEPMASSFTTVLEIRCPRSAQR